MSNDDKFPRDEVHVWNQADAERLAELERIGGGQTMTASGLRLAIAWRDLVMAIRSPIEKAANRVLARGRKQSVRRV